MQDRNAALNKLIRCLEDYEVVGLPTNIDFLLTCAQHPTFRAGTVDTGFIDEYASATNGTQNAAAAARMPRRDSLNATLFVLHFV